jgi:hypothetical protein
LTPTAAFPVIDPPNPGHELPDGTGSGAATPIETPDPVKSVTAAPLPVNEMGSPFGPLPTGFARDRAEEELVVDPETVSTAVATTPSAKVV